MLSDDFLNGLLFNVVRDKWRRWACFFFLAVYVWPKLVFTALLTCLAAPSLFEAPAMPLEASSSSDPPDTLAFQQGVCILSSYLIVLELFEIGLCIRTHWRTHPAQRESHRTFLLEMVNARLIRYAWLSDVSIACALVASVDLLGAADAAEAHERRQSESICVLLAIATISSWMYSVLECLVSSQGVGIFTVLVGEMLRADVLKFMILYIPTLIGFGAGLTALFPSSTTRASSIWSSIENLIILSLVGEPPEIGGTIYPTVFMKDTEEGRQWIQVSLALARACERALHAFPPQHAACACTKVVHVHVHVHVHGHVHAMYMCTWAWAWHVACACWPPAAASSLSGHDAYLVTAAGPY